MDLSKKQIQFLNTLNNYQNSTESLLRIGKKVFKTEVSIYDAIQLFENLGYIKLSKEIKLIKFVVTLKGRNFLMKQFDNTTKFK